MVFLVGIRLFFWFSVWRGWGFFGLFGGGGDLGFLRGSMVAFVDCIFFDILGLWVKGSGVEGKLRVFLAIVDES